MRKPTSEEIERTKDSIDNFGRLLDDGYNIGLPLNDENRLEDDGYDIGMPIPIIK